mmetsp:Transcript_28021/g.37885  ORF Transcript_28021/g.37885 Transcript_28021/m.37885 type:complete len:82 (-) Transcript_28021:354-599(-)
MHGRSALLYLCSLAICTSDMFAAANRSDLEFFPNFFGSQETFLRQCFHKASQRTVRRLMHIGPPIHQVGRTTKGTETCFLR